MIISAIFLNQLLAISDNARIYFPFPLCLSCDVFYPIHISYSVSLVAKFNLGLLIFPFRHSKYMAASQHHNTI
jgi:hypothetical protein